MRQRDQTELNVDFGHALETEALEAMVVLDVPEDGRLGSAKISQSAEDLRAVIGPGIGPESFQVGSEIVEVFKEQGFPMDKIWSFRGEARENMVGGHHIDLFMANRWLLEEAGVHSENIYIAGIDTYKDTSFYSARREGIKTGRIISGIVIL